jgi:hypothetical protein
MDLLKTPQQMLMEETGANPSASKMLNTPQQMLMHETGVLPHLAGGGQPQMSPQDMLASLVASGHLPAHYAPGGLVKNIAGQSAMTLPLMGEELNDIGKDIANQKYAPAAMKTGAAGYSAFAPFNPLTALISGMTYSPEAGAGSTINEWLAARELEKNPPKKEPAAEKKRSALYNKTMVK